ncbi:MAG: RidA family protein [Phycisphaerales bacterium]|jgi:enamine deaminase RidA (YjgF/YER057c/UK114 family)|nr:RidA family protein [Phycisphaerales bacterium]
MKRTNVSSGTVWETEVGYSRAVRTGPFVFVTGTVAADETGTVTSPGDAYEQTLQAIDKVAAALARVGAGVEDIVRTRIYITDMADAADVGRAHKRKLGHVMPATTMVAVAGLWGEGSVVEIEADAVVGDQ